jgi:ribosome-binding factor A
MMKSHRLDRLQNEIKKIFNQTLSTKMNDQRLDWVIISEVILSKDMSYLKVYFSHYNNPRSHDKIREMLNRASGFFKKQIAGAKLMRTIPEITFFYDETEERAARVDSLLASVKDDFDEEDDYDPDIDLDDYLDEDEFFEIDEDEDDLDDIDDTDETEEEITE